MIIYRYMRRREFMITRKGANALEIARIEASRRADALELIERVFMQFEAPDYSDEGVMTFKQTVIYNEEYLDGLTMYGAYVHGTLAGVIATRSQGNHIALFFVHGQYQKRGIGRALFQRALKDSAAGEVTVNSSPYAANVYRKLGFSATSQEQSSGGMRYTPMVYTK